jgi:GTP cyclohydrolase III
MLDETTDAECKKASSCSNTDGNATDEDRGDEFTWIDEADETGKDLKTLYFDLINMQ